MVIWRPQVGHAGILRYCKILMATGECQQMTVWIIGKGNLKKKESSVNSPQNMYVHATPHLLVVSCTFVKMVTLFRTVRRLART